MTAPFETPPTGLRGAKALDASACGPVLTSDRLTLRAMRVEDFEIFAEIFTGPRSYGVGGPMPRSAVWYEFAALTGGWLLHGIGGWTITVTKTGTAVGFVLVGLEPGDKGPELGYMLGKDHEGHGYATEAAQTARRYAFDVMKLPELVSYISLGNTASVAVADRLGAVKIHEKRYPETGGGVSIYQHLNPVRLA